jgi:hypothetical protein
MKKYICVALFLLAFFFSSVAQTKYSYAVYYSPALTSRITRASDDLNWLKSESDKLEKSEFGYAAGVFIEREMNNSWSVRGGIGFSVFSEKIDSLDYLGIDKYRNEYRFIEVPLVATRFFGKSALNRPYMSLGYSLNCFLNKETTYSLVGSSREESTVNKGDENQLSHALRISVGYDFALDKKWNFRAELFSTQFITSLTQSDLKRLPNSLGLSLQIRKK